MTQAEENKIFKQSIVPIMDKYRKAHPDTTMDMYFVSVVSQMRKQNIPLDNTIVNMMMDKMARDSMPKGTWDYISGKVMDGNLVKLIYDVTHPNARDSPFDTEIKRRAEIMYKASTSEKVAASLATAGADTLVTAPIALSCPQSVVYGFLLQGGYDILYDKILLPESKEERTAAANESIRMVNALDEKTNGKIVPGWMLSKYGIRNYSEASDAKLEKARDWADRNARWWHDEYEKLGREKKLEFIANGKKFTRAECLVKYNQYEHFRGNCQQELTTRYLAKMDAQEKQRQEALASKIQEEDNTDEQSVAHDKNPGESTDFWGHLLNTLGFNGLGNVGRHMGLTLAMLPDTIFGIFTGKTKSIGMGNDTLIPLASLAAGHFVKNPMLKAALMGYGGLNILNKVGNEAISLHKGESVESVNVRYKQYADEALNPRIANLHIEGDQLLADIDKVPCAITLPNNAIKAYQSGALPLNTLANAVLAKSDLMAQQSEHASLAYSNMQHHEQSRGIR